MEDYIGVRLLFETSRGVVSGMLRAIDEEEGKLIVESEEGLKDVFVDDLQRLEIIYDTGEEDISGAESEHGKSFQNIVQVGNKMTSKEHDNEGECATLSHENHIECTENKMDVENICSYAVESFDKTARPDAYRRNDGEVVRVCTNEVSEEQHVPRTNSENYLKMMDRAFTYFGPLEDEFSAVIAHRAYEVFTMYFARRGMHISVFVCGDGVFSSIGFIFGRLLLKDGEYASIVCDEDFIKTARHKQSYLNSGGVITNKIRKETDTHVYACSGDVTTSYFEGSPIKSALYFDIPRTVKGMSENMVGLCFGSVPQHSEDFPGIVHLIDAEYPTILYNEFGLPKQIGKKICRIK